MSNALDICIPDDLLRLQGSDLEHGFFTLVFPPLFAIGIVGNCLNLIVLLNTDAKNRHRPNRLLIALAVCDILFLLLMLPHCLANFDYFSLNNNFRYIYFTLKMHLISLANWVSAIAIWLVISICTERLLGIRSLLRANSQCWTTSHLISILVIVLGLLTFHNHFSFFCIIKDLCNHTQIISKCFDVVQEDWPGNRTNNTPPLIKAYVKWSIVLNLVLNIMIPVFIMIILNFALLLAIRSQSFLKYNRLVIENNSISLKNENADGESKEPVVFRRSIDQTSQFHTEHRVTVAVCAIVSCFTITQGPSAIVLLLSFLYGHQHPFTESNPHWYNISTITGFLVIIGKTLNFILFCLSSAAFRRRLVKIIGNKLRVLSRRSSLSGAPLQSSLRKYSVAQDF